MHTDAEQCKAFLGNYRKVRESLILQDIRDVLEQMQCLQRLGLCAYP